MPSNCHQGAIASWCAAEPNQIKFILQEGNLFFLLSTQFKDSVGFSSPREIKAFVVIMRGNFVSGFILAAMLAGCSIGGGDWPNLSDPLPDPKDRERQIERAEAQAPVDPNLPLPASRPGMKGAVPKAPTEDTAPTTESEAATLLKDIKESLRLETLAYREAKAQISGAEGEDLQDRWFAAQLALTRLSSTASRLDALIGFEAPEIAAQANTEADILEKFIVAERQKLFETKP